MKLYLPDDGSISMKQLNDGWWALYADVKCRECGKEWALSMVGDVGGKYPKCGGECI